MDSAWQYLTGIELIVSRIRSTKRCLDPSVCTSIPPDKVFYPFQPCPPPYSPPPPFPNKFPKILPKSGVPNPEATSHPSFAGNPDLNQTPTVSSLPLFHHDMMYLKWRETHVLHPQIFPPSTSLNARPPFLYSQGFRKPSGGRPAARRASLTFVRTSIYGISTCLRERKQELVGECV